MKIFLLTIYFVNFAAVETGYWPSITTHSISECMKAGRSTINNLNTLLIYQDDDLVAAFKCEEKDKDVNKVRM